MVERDEITLMQKSIKIQDKYYWLDYNSHNIPMLFY
jgi:hypothetical protein